MPLKSITRTVIAVLAAAISLAASNRKFDVVVYGGTAGGVATAVAAARQGMTVALLEPGRHLGGMVSGGLGWTDLGKKEVLFAGPIAERLTRLQMNVSIEFDYTPSFRAAKVDHASSDGVLAPELITLRAQLSQTIPGARLRFGCRLA